MKSREPRKCCWPRSGDSARKKSGASLPPTAKESGNRLWGPFAGFKGELVSFHGTEPLAGVSRGGKLELMVTPINGKRDVS